MFKWKMPVPLTAERVENHELWKTKNAKPEDPQFIIAGIMAFKSWLTLIHSYLMHKFDSTEIKFLT